MSEEREATLRAMAIRVFESGQPVKEDRLDEFEEAVLAASQNHPDGRALFAAFINRSNYEAIGEELGVKPSEARLIFESFLDEVREEVKLRNTDAQVLRSDYWLVSRENPLDAGSNHDEPVS